MRLPLSGAAWLMPPRSTKTLNHLSFIFVLKKSHSISFWAVTHLMENIREEQRFTVNVPLVICFILKQLERLCGSRFCSGVTAEILAVCWAVGGSCLMHTAVTWRKYSTNTSDFVYKAACQQRRLLAVEWRHKQPHTKSGSLIRKHLLYLFFVQA